MGRNRELVTFYPSTKLALFSMQLNLIPGLSNLQFLNALYSYFGSIIYVNSLSREILQILACLPKRSCCGSQSTIITLSVNFLCNLLPFSHFQKTRCGIRAKTRTNISTICAGIEDTGMADPKVKTMQILLK